MPFEYSPLSRLPGEFRFQDLRLNFGAAGILFQLPPSHFQDFRELECALGDRQFAKSLRLFRYHIGRVRKLDRNLHGEPSTTTFYAIQPAYRSDSTISARAARQAGARPARAPMASVTANPIRATRGDGKNAIETPSVPIERPL